jgi:hypothetical protein
MVLPISNISLRAQCPNITDIIVFNSVQSGSDCTFDLEIDTDVAIGSPANKSMRVYILLNGTEIINECIKVKNNGNNPPELIENITLPCSTDLNDLVITYQGYDGNASCGGNGNGVGNQPCDAAPELFTGLILGSLPVELIAFQATKERFHQVQLEWVTASEENNAMFSIEHSTDARNFEELAKIEGNGTTNQEQYYRYMDKFPSNGLNYYRLKQINFDGTFSYSEIISIEIEKNTTKPFVIANSLSKDEITLIFNETPKDNTRLEVFNTAGILLYQNKINPETAYLSINIRAYEPGMYIVRVPLGKEYLVDRFIKIGE